MLTRSRLAIVLAVSMLATGLAGCIGGDDLTPTETPGDDGDEAPLFSNTSVFPGDYDTDQPRTLEAGPHGVGEQSVTLVESDLDGTDIMIYVMQPDVPEGETVPVIADVSPYFPPLQGADLSGNEFLVHNFVSHGYAVALVSVRGTGDSGGCMDLMGPAERHDVDQAITWLGEQDWSNGNVGMFGGSYDGSTQWQAASTGNPHLKTIVPLAGIPDLFSFMFHNGTFQTWAPAQFYGLYWLFYGPVSYNPTNGRSAMHTLEQAVCPEAAEAMTASVQSTLTGERDPLGFWEERDWRDDVLANYTGTTYLIQGFQDTTVEPHSTYEFVRELDETGRTVKYTLGPWGHELPWRADAMEIMLHWYDRWLKEDTSVDIGPKVQLMDTQGHWHDEQAWPPEDATPRTLYLTPEGDLADEPAEASGQSAVAAKVPVQHPVVMLERFNGPWKPYEDPVMEVCPECPTFELGPVEETLRFTGTPRVHVTVTPTGPGGHVTANLYTVDGDGQATPVGMGQMDLRHADGDEEAETVTPGEPLTLQLRLEALDVAVPSGHSLVIAFHQGSYGTRAPSVPTSPVMLHTGGEASTVTLDVIARGLADDHDAPEPVGDPAGPR